MARWGMVIDLRKCVGCQTCTIACKQENATPPGVFWRRVLDAEVGEYPKVARFFLPVGCMHCGDPPCLEVCPTTATKRRDDGIVTIDEESCVGCGYCVVACPYQARYLIHEVNWYFVDGPTPPEEIRSFRTRVGTCTKCTFCYPRIDQAHQDGKRPGVDHEVTPVCVLSCIANAIHFGNLDDPESPVSRLIKEHDCFRIHEELGTDPSIYYIRG